MAVFIHGMGSSPHLLMEEGDEKHAAHYLAVHPPFGGCTAAHESVGFATWQQSGGN